ERERDNDEEERQVAHGLSALENDAFDYVGDVFALVDRGFNDFEDFFPLDDLHGIFFFVEKLGDQSSAEAVTFIFVAIDFDAMPQRFVGRIERPHGGRDFRGREQKNLCEFECSRLDGGNAIEDEAAGSCVDQINDVVELAAERMNIFAIEGDDESLIQFGENGVRDFVAVVLDGFDALNLFGHAGVMREQFDETARSFLDVLRLLDEQLKKIVFARQKPLQKSWHVVRLPWRV